MNVRVITVAFLLALVGCGGDKTPMTDADVATITRWSAAYKPVAGDMLTTSGELAKERLDPAGAALTAVRPKLATADAEVAKLQTAPLRATLADYMRITHRCIDAFDALLKHLRTNPGDRRERIRVMEELGDANKELFAADSKIRDRIFDHADEAQEKRLDAVIPLPVQS